MILVFALPCETIFFSSHIEEKTNMHGLSLRNIIKLLCKLNLFFPHILLFHELWSINFGPSNPIFKFFKNKVFFQKSYILVIFMSMLFGQKSSNLENSFIWEGNPIDHFWSFSFVIQSMLFDQKSSNQCNDPKITFGPNPTLIKGNKSRILVIFILFSRAL